MRISLWNNPFETFARRMMWSHQADLGRAIERLATGKRINRASDDPAGMQAATDLKVELRSIEKRIEGLERGNANLAAKEGALSVVNDQLLELQGIVVQAANTGGLSDEELEALNLQAGAVLEGIDYLANTTRFGGQQVIQGYTAATLGLAGLDLSDPEAAQDAVEAALKSLSRGRATIGNQQNENLSQMDVLRVELEEKTGALSNMEDADYAQEVSNMVRSQLLEQMTIRTQLIAREQAGSVLKLLDGAVGVGL